MKLLRNIQKFSLIPLLLQLIVNNGLAQQGPSHSYIHYDAKDGLAGPTVYSMAEDRDGFIWMGTETGLSRFDGTQFRNYTTADGLPDNEIIKVFVDSRNRIWLLAFNKSVSYIYNSRIHNKDNDSILHKLNQRSQIVEICENRAGDLMLCEGVCVHIIHPDGSISEIRPGKQEFGFELFGTTSGGDFRVSIIHYNVSVPNKNYFHFADIISNNLIPDSAGGSYPLNSSGNIYIGPGLDIIRHKDSLTFYYHDTRSRIKAPSPKGLIHISYLNDSIITFNTFASTYLVDMRTRKIVDSFLEGQTVNNTMQDSEGNLWFTTLDKGVYRLNSMDMLHYSFGPPEKNLPVFTVHEWDSTLYIGTDRFYLWSLDLQTRKIHGTQIMAGFTRGRVIDMARRSDGTIYIGTDAGVFSSRDFKNQEQFKTPNFVARAIKSLTILNDSLLLESSNVATILSNLNKMDPNDESESQYIRIIWKDRSTCSFFQQGRYYVGTLAGLYMVDTADRNIYLGELDKCFTYRIMAMARGRHGLIWVATDGAGVAALDGNKVVARLTHEQGLTSDICRCVYLSGSDLWIGTDKGLNRISYKGSAYQVMTYTTADGLASDVINSVWVTNHQVYVGTSAGLDFFNENRVHFLTPCRLNLDAITVSGEQRPVDTIELVLPHKDNNIRFSYSGISYRSAGRMQYRYRLRGLDDTWKTTRESFLSYPSLPSGNYILEIQAINKFGVASNKLSLRFTVEKLLWEKFWFRILVALLLFAGVFLYFQNTIRRVRKKESEKADTAMKMAELEQMALRSQMNPHFIFNSLNSIQEFVMDKDIIGANEFITNFSHLIRQTLDLSSRSLITLEEEFNYLSTYLELEKRRFDYKFIYQIDVAEDIDLQSFRIPPMILQPFLENAVRYGMGYRQDKNGRIFLRVESNEKYLICIVEDNGVGRKKAGLFKSLNSIHYQSKGMSLVAKRIEMINKAGGTPILIEVEDLYGANGDASGTRIVLQFPLERQEEN